MVYTMSTMISTVIFVMMHSSDYGVTKECVMLFMHAGDYGVPKRWYFLFTKSYWCSQYSSDDCAVDSSNVELICNQSS